MSTWLQALGWQVAAGAPQTGWTWDARRAAYARWDAYVDNTIYLPQAAGGFREAINATLGNAAAADLAGLYLPFAAVTELYLHVFGGRFRAPTDDAAEDTPTDIRLSSPHAATLAALAQIVAWSNLTIERQPLCRLAATHGTVGLRIVARDDPAPARRRVYVTPDHPRTIRDVALDDRGNVTAAELEYDVTRGVGEAAETITVRETLDKAQLATSRVAHGRLVPLDLAAWRAGRDTGPNVAIPNALGVVPYVLLRHEYDGGMWGRNAFHRACAPADRLNALLTHLDVQIHDHVRATWLVAANGAAPAEFDFSGRKVLYVNIAGGAAPPAIEALIAKLDLPGARQQAELHLSLIEDALPELKATAGKYLSGQSGETIAQLRKPAEDKLQLARTNYEDALTRSLEIALSWGVLLGCWDLGTGTGTRAAADAAYQRGFAAFTFNDRPLLRGGATEVTP